MFKKGKLLIVAHAYPPSGGAGVRRLIKVIDFLDDNGWEITIISPRRGEYFAYPYDPSLLKEIPSTVRILETFTPESLFMHKSVASGQQVGRRTRNRSIPFSQIYRLIYKLFGSVIAIPESSITWLPFAVWRGFQLFRESGFDLIYATAPPFSALLVGALIKRVSKKPLVVEFRDAWISEPTRVYDSLWRRFIESRQENFVINTADQVVSMTDGVSSDFKRRSSRHSERRKFVTIPNGFDPADRGMLRESNRDRLLKDRFNIVYTGTLGGKRTPWYFLLAVKKLLDANPHLGTELCIHFVGHNGAFHDGNSLEDYVRRLELDKVVNLAGFVSREESLQYQMEADVLLIIVGIVPEDRSQCYGLSAKVFDYVTAEKPILAIAEPGATADFIIASGCGEVISHYDQEGICSAIGRALRGQLHFAPKRNFLMQYDNQSLFKRLDLALSSLINHQIEFEK